jgi:general nucleoside transport system permease protein
VVSRPSRPAYPIFFSATALFILAFLVWIARGSNVGTVPPLELTGILGLSFISATPLIYGSLSGVMCERAGVVNIAIEGQFMFGAMSGAIVASVIGGTTLGLVAGTAVAGAFGALLGCALAYMALHFRANQIIVGVVIVAFCTAMVQFMMDQVLNNKQSLNTGVGALPIAIPGLSKIPFFGPIFFDQTYFVYLAVVLVALVNFVLFRTRIGLRVRAVGEKPKAAETVGLSVVRIRYGMVILGGFVAGIGGAVFTIGSGIPMGVGITGGEGFIALAIMIFGRWRPWRAFAATMLFGFTIAIGSQMQVYLNQLVIPTELIYALPYIVTIAAVAGLVGKVRPPASDGIPYFRE